MQSCCLTYFDRSDHSDISGNEAADRLAKAGAQTPFIRPEPALEFCPWYSRALISKFYGREGSLRPEVKGHAGFAKRAQVVS